MNLVLFDIDGTLVDSVGYESGLYGDAIDEVLDETVDRDWSRYRHVTDGGVLDEIIAARPRSLSADEIHQRVHDAFIGKLRAHFRNYPDAVREISGAVQLVDALRRRADCAVGIATGGWRAAAELKLAAIGVDTRQLEVATGSDARARADIMRIAAERTLAASPAAEQAPSRRIYFGDREWDQRACAELGFEFVAVGTAVEHPVRLPALAPLERVLSTLKLEG